MIAVVANPKMDLPASSGRNSVRIIAGIWRGRRVHFPDIPGLRPTPDRVRGAYFSILGNAIPGRVFVDIFAGTGVSARSAASFFGGVT